MELYFAFRFIILWRHLIRNENEDVLIINLNCTRIRSLEIFLNCREFNFFISFKCFRIETESYQNLYSLHFCKVDLIICHHKDQIKQSVIICNHPLALLSYSITRYDCLILIKNKKAWNPWEAARVFNLTSSSELKTTRKINWMPTPHGPQSWFLMP